MPSLTCTNTDARYILEFIGCDLVVVQNSETIFKAKELSLCPWFDEISEAKLLVFFLQESLPKTDSFNPNVLQIRSGKKQVPANPSCLPGQPVR